MAGAPLDASHTRHYIRPRNNHISGEIHAVFSLQSPFVMQYYLLDNPSSHLAGREVGENKNAIFSPFFALKSLKKTIRFLLDFVSKPMQKCNIFPQLLMFCRNILQTNKLSWLSSHGLFSIERTKLPHNLLTYKVLTQGKRKIKEKCKKRIDFSLVF